MRHSLRYGTIMFFITAMLFGSLACSSTSATTTSSTPATTSSTPATTTAYTINVASKTGVGSYLVDGKGMTLYWTTRDAVGKSNITGATLANWPAFQAPNIAVPGSLRSADFSSITRPEGGSQTTYKGWPLYYFIKDQAAGDTLGQGLAGVWSVVDPASSAPAPVPTVTITTPTSGQNVAAGDLTVTITVTNFNVVDKQGQPSVAGEGHVHFYLDIPAPTTAGKPAVPASGVWAHVSGTTYTFSNVTPGPHTITVQLVNNDHTPLIPVVTAQVNVTVGAAATTTPPPTTTSPPTTTVPPSTTTPPAPQGYSITISGYAFSPASATVSVGTKVTWTNMDPTSHTVTSNTNVFSSPNLGTGGTFSYTFNTPGTYSYHCSIHTYMTGTITVQ
jgi:predicted lipoprotein with Yx(FWY)xxD motif/plastocyanin